MISLQIPLSMVMSCDIFWCTYNHGYWISFKPASFVKDLFCVYIGWLLGGIFLYSGTSLFSNMLLFRIFITHKEKKCCFVLIYFSPNFRFFPMPKMKRLRGMDFYLLCPFFSLPCCHSAPPVFLSFFCSSNFISYNILKLIKIYKKINYWFLWTEKWVQKYYNISERY